MDQLTPPTSYTDDAKQAAIDQWTADPCEGVDGEPGSRAYFEGVMSQRDVGFADVSTTVRHYLPSDTSITRLLAPRLPVLRSPAVLDRLGRIGGWYVVGRGRRPVGR